VCRRGHALAFICPPYTILLYIIIIIISITYLSDPKITRARSPFRFNVCIHLKLIITVVFIIHVLYAARTIFAVHERRAVWFCRGTCDIHTLHVAAYIIQRTRYNDFGETPFAINIIMTYLLFNRVSAGRREGTSVREMDAAGT